MANSYYQRKATIDAILAKTPEALKRDKKTDYTSGYFFVTLNIHDHKPLLGTIIGLVDTQTAQVTDPSIQLSTLGQIVQTCWHNISKYHPNVQIIDCVVMPEHFHGLLHMDHVEGVTLSLIIKGFKLGCNRAYRELESLTSASLFSSGFNETIPITPEEVETKRQYIHDNPRRRLIKDHLRDRFTVYRGQHSANWTINRIRQGLRQDLTLARDEDELLTAMDELRPRLLLNEAAAPTLDCVGMTELMKAQHKLSLICHRSDAEHFAAQEEAVLRAARDGAVIVSAFISPRERNILKLLLAERASIIEILDNGLSKTYKPWGASFDACATGKLLQITPWKYVYQRDATISRPQCMAMNELARLISGVEDDWWKR